MKVLICGSRDWTDEDAVRARVAALPEEAIVIEGEARGVDRMARKAAEDLVMLVAKVKVEDAYWKKYGRRAGPRRNAAMLSFGPDLVVAFQLDGSSGTQSTIDMARERGIPVELHTAGLEHGQEAA